MSPSPQPLLQTKNLLFKLIENIRVAYLDYGALLTEK